jgi:hypothetical protein
MAEISNKAVKEVRFQQSLKGLKDQAHKYFDMLWKHGYIERNAGYEYLACWLGVPEPQAHMSKMDKDKCKQVIECSIQMLNDMRRLDLDFDAPINHPYYDLIK